MNWLKWTSKNLLLQKHFVLENFQMTTTCGTRIWAFFACLVIFDANSEVKQFQLGSFEYAKWNSCAKMVRAISGLSLSDDMLEHVHDRFLAREMLRITKNIVKRHIFLNKLHACRRFCSVRMKWNEKKVMDTKRVQPCGSVLKSMGVEPDNRVVAMAILSGLPSKSENLLTPFEYAKRRQKLVYNWPH